MARRRREAEVQAPETGPVPTVAYGEVALVDANADARRTAAALAAKRDRVIAAMMQHYIAAYGPARAPHVRRFLRDLIDGKPLQKKPVRAPMVEAA